MSTESTLYISIEIENTKQQITEVLNNSKLPFCILQFVMEEALRAVKDVAQQEYQNDLQKQAASQSASAASSRAGEASRSTTLAKTSKKSQTAQSSKEGD